MECGCMVNTTQEDFLSHYAGQKLLSDNFKKRESNAESRKQILYESSSHAVGVFKVLDSLRKEYVFCDTKLETDDGTIVHAHKNILASATPFFHAMLFNIKEGKKTHVILREVDSTSLKCLVDYIYTAQIMITEENVQVLLHAANLLQLHDVRDVCCDFLQTQLNPTNCLGIKALISLNDCKEYLPSFKSYIQQNFTMVVQSDAFLCLEYEELVELISSNELNDISEEKVFECVINWVNHDLSYRNNFLPKLMGHVRLPLVSKEYLLNKVYEEPFIKNNFECTNYLLEALRFHLLNSDNQVDTIPKTIRTKPRQPFGSYKIILFVGLMSDGKTTTIQWYDPLTNRWQLGPEISMSRPEELRILGVFNNQSLYFLSGLDDKNILMLDLFSPSPCLQHSVAMLHKRINLGVAVLNNCIYAVGGENDLGTLKNVEVFNFNTQKWTMISEMSIARSSCSVGILNNHLYAVGGYDGDSEQYLNSVERYCTRTNTWTPVANMNVCRCDVGVGVLNGVLYVVGGFNGESYLNSVEVYNPSSNTWSFVSNMNICRSYADVVALDGSLYVFFGDDLEDDVDDSKINYSAEVYNPKTDVWSMLTLSEHLNFKSSGAVVIDKPKNLKI